MKVQKSYSHYSGNGGRRNNGGGGGKKQGNTLNYADNFDRKCNWCGKTIVLAALEKPTSCPHCHETLPLTVTSGSFTRCPRCWMVTNTMWKFCDCGRFNESALGKHSRAKLHGSTETVSKAGGRPPPPPSSASSSSSTSSTSSSTSALLPPPVAPPGLENVGPCRPMRGNGNNIAIVAMVRQLREEFAAAQTQRLELQKRMEEVESESQGLLEQQVVLVGEREEVVEERRKLAQEAEQIQQLRMQLAEERRLAQQMVSHEVFNAAVAQLNIGDRMEEEIEDNNDNSNSNDEEEERILNSVDE